MIKIIIWMVLFEIKYSECIHLSQLGLIFSWVCTTLAAIRILLNMPLIFLDPEDENPVCISGVFRCSFWLECIIQSVFFLAFLVIIF